MTTNAGTNGASLVPLVALLTMTASLIAVLMIWTMLTEPLTIATVVSGDEARAIVVGVFNVLYDALKHFLQYF